MSTLKEKKHIYLEPVSEQPLRVEEFLKIAEEVFLASNQSIVIVKNSEENDGLDSFSPNLISE